MSDSTADLRLQRLLRYLDSAKGYVQNRYIYLYICYLFINSIIQVGNYPYNGYTASRLPNFPRVEQAEKRARHRQLHKNHIDQKACRGKPQEDNRKASGHQAAPCQRLGHFLRGMPPCTGFFFFFFFLLLLRLSRGNRKGFRAGGALQANLALAVLSMRRPFPHGAAQGAARVGKRRARRVCRRRRKGRAVRNRERRGEDRDPPHLRGSSQQARARRAEPEPLCQVASLAPGRTTCARWPRPCGISSSSQTAPSSPRT